METLNEANEMPEPRLDTWNEERKPEDLTRFVEGRLARLAFEAEGLLDVGTDDFELAA